MRPNRLRENTVQQQAQQANRIWEARQQARHDVVDRFETIDRPQDVGIDHRNGGVGPSDAFLDWAEPQEMAHQFDQDIGHYDVGVDDVHETDEGWGLTSGGERRVAASEFEQETELDHVDPYDDIERTDDGFQLVDDVAQGLFY